MSFYKITDPEERRRMFEKLAATRKNVREQFLEDKIGRKLGNFFQTRRRIAKRINKEYNGTTHTYQRGYYSKSGSDTIWIH